MGEEKRSTSNQINKLVLNISSLQSDLFFGGGGLVDLISACTTSRLLTYICDVSALARRAIGGETVSATMCHA